MSNLDELLKNINTKVTPEDVELAQRSAQQMKSQSSVAIYRMFAAPVN